MGAIGFQELSQLAGGVVLFLFGLHLASDNLKAVAGSRLKVIIKLLTANRFLGLLAGILGTILVQSNTATAVILVGLCEAGVLALGRSIGVLLGANLGSTVTVQVVAFDLYAYALLLVTIGFMGIIGIGTKGIRYGGAVVATFGGLLLVEGLTAPGGVLLLVGAATAGLSYVGERQSAGRAMIGLGLIFVGMRVISVAMAVLKNDSAFSQLVVDFQTYPLLVIAASFVFTVLTNSSTATLGTAIALGSAGGTQLISPEGAVAIVMGAHLGSCPMALLSGAGAGRIARQVSYAHVFIKVAGVLVVYPVLHHFAGVLTSFNGWMGASSARAVANAHTLFNLVNVLTILPFTPQVATLLDRLLPEENRQIQGILQHISEEQMEFRPMAMESVELEMKRLAFKVRSLVRLMAEALQSTDAEPLQRMETLDDEIDGLFTSILAFLTRMGKERLGNELFQRLITMVHVLTNLEGIGDRISKDFSGVMKKRIDQDVQFSFEGLQLLLQLHTVLLERMDAIIHCLGAGERCRILSVVMAQDEFAARTRTMKKAHFKQLVKGVHEAEDTSMIYLDTLAIMRNIHQAIVDIAENIRYCPYYGSDTTGSKPADQSSPPVEAMAAPATPPPPTKPPVSSAMSTMSATQKSASFMAAAIIDEADDQDDSIDD